MKNLSYGIHGILSNHIVRQIFLEDNFTRSIYPVNLKSSIKPLRYIRLFCIFENFVVEFTFFGQLNH